MVPEVIWISDDDDDEVVVIENINSNIENQIHEPLRVSSPSQLLIEKPLTIGKRIKQSRRIKATETAWMSSISCQEDGYSIITTNPQVVNDFVDESFPSDYRSISGVAQVADNVKAPMCLCENPCIQKKVSKEGQNNGKYFWCCGTRTCNTFQWVEEGEVLIREKDKNWIWKRAPSHYRLFGSLGPRPEDVRQGSLGDCWFLSALSILAERRDLIDRLFVTKLDKNSRFQLHLFMNCGWNLVTVDNLFPCRPGLTKLSKSAQSRVDTNFLLVYSKAFKKRLWVPIIEKAYAKCYGSYRAISGGWIAEAMFDLTGCPTETIRIGTVERDEFFTRLGSYASQKFPMGAGCSSPDKSSGLHGSHAYSILGVTTTNLKAEKQPTITSMFGSNKKKRQKMEFLNLIKLRNPWGTGEWTGRFGRHSPEWTSELRRELGHTDENNGCFYMLFDDFLTQFSGGSIDICKAPETNWFVFNHKDAFEPNSWYSRNALRIKTGADVTWTYVTACQAGTRGKVGGDWNLVDIAIIIVRVCLNGDFEQCIISLPGQSKTHHTECLLKPDSEYLVIPFSIGKYDKNRKRYGVHIDFAIRLMSAKVLQVCFLKVLSSHTIVDALHTAILGSTVEKVSKLGDCEIFAKKSEGACLVFAVNRSKRIYYTCGIAVLGVSSVASEDKDPPLYVVPPNSCRIISAISNYGFQDYKNSDGGIFFILPPVILANETQVMDLPPEVENIHAVRRISDLPFMIE